MSNGQQWGTVVGGIVGSFFGATQLGMAVGGMIGGAIDPERIHLPSIGDAQQQTAQAGVPRPVVYGHPAPFAGNIIDGEGKARKIQVKDKGKGGPVVYSEKFLLTYAIRICEGPIAGVIRIWRNGELVYDARTAAQIAAIYGGDTLSYTAEQRAKSAAFKARCRIYLGDEDQLPDPALEVIHGVGNTPYYRGTAYIVVEDDDVTQMGGAAAQYQFEVASAGTILSDDTTWFTSSTTGIVKSDTGADWLAAPAIEAGNSIFSGAGKVVNVDSGVVGSTGKTTSDAGVLWQTHTGLAAVTCNQGALSNSTYLIAANARTVNRSADGVAYTTALIATGVLNSNLIAITASASRVMVGGSADINGKNVALSLDAGATFPTSSMAFTVGTGNREVIGLANDGSRVVAVGNDTANGRMARSDDWTTWTQIALPFVNAASPVVCVTHGGGVWVAANAAGEIAWSSNGAAWTLSASAFGAIPAAVAYGAGRYIMVGALTMKYSVDGCVTWTTITHNQTGAITGITAMAAGGGTELPDAPGYYLQDDGTVSGPESATVSPDAITLRSVVEDIASRCGVPAGKLDATALTDTIPGYLIAGQATGADCLRPTQQMFFYDLPEVDGPIVAVKRGGPLAATITDDDMLASSDDEEETRPQQIEYPAKVSVVTQDPAAEYSPVPQTSIRSSINVNATSEVTIQSPIPFSGDEAAQKAQIIHKVLFAQAEGRKDFALPEEYSYLVPSDCIGHNGKRWLIEKKDSADGENRFECSYDRATAYASTATGSSATPPSLPGTGLRGPTTMVAMNLPQLRTEDNTPGMYVAVRGLMADWAGCALYLSVDGGVTEQPVRTIINAATMGYLSADLAIAGATLSVDVRGELESVSLAQITARANAFAIISGGVAEVGQFQTATLTASGVTDAYDLTDLYRGRLGTAAAAHVAGVRFVELDSSVYFVPINILHAGKTLIFRAVTLGTDPANNATFSAVFDPQLTPAPVYEFYTDAGGNRYTAADGTYYFKES